MSALDEDTLDCLRQKLAHLKDEIEATLSRSKKAAQPVELDQQAIGRVSRIDAIQQQKMVEANRSRLKIRLNQVKAALTAIHEDDYGYCRRCEENIQLRRLMAKPESAICLSCQASIEARGG